MRRKAVLILAAQRGGHVQKGIHVPIRRRRRDPGLGQQVAIVIDHQRVGLVGQAPQLAVLLAGGQELRIEVVRRIACIPSPQGLQGADVLPDSGRLDRERASKTVGGRGQLGQVDGGGDDLDPDAGMGLLVGAGQPAVGREVGIGGGGKGEGGRLACEGRRLGAGAGGEQRG